MKSSNIIECLDRIIPNPVCELNYNKDYELLISVMLSARCTDKMVNSVTKVLFNKYNIFDLSKLSYIVIEDIIRPVGSHERKSKYVVEIAKSLVNDYDGIVPNNRDYLESLPGVGRKTCNVVLSLLYNEPCLAVDTHVERVSKRLGLVSNDDNVLDIEKKLCNFFPKEKWSRLHLQLVLFGRYYCTSRFPKCDNCILKEYCKKNEL